MTLLLQYNTTVLDNWIPVISTYFKELPSWVNLKETNVKLALEVSIPICRCTLLAVCREAVIDSIL